MNTVHPFYEPIVIWPNGHKVIPLYAEAPYFMPEAVAVQPTGDSYIRFMAPVVPETSAKLMQLIDAKLQQKRSRLHILISSPGGSVFHGLSIYNYLKAIPIEVYTYNFGSVDSIGVILFCSGSRRLSVPHARFLMHGVKMNFNGQMALDEKELEEKLKALKIDQFNISKVIADTVGKQADEVEGHMNSRTTLNPQQAQEYGLVHEIKSQIIPPNADLSVIFEPANTPQMQLPFQVQMPRAISIPDVSGYTRSLDLEIGSNTY